MYYLVLFLEKAQLNLHPRKKKKVVIGRNMANALLKTASSFDGLSKHFQNYLLNP